MGRITRYRLRRRNGLEGSDKKFEFKGTSLTGRSHENMSKVQQVQLVPIQQVEESSQIEPIVGECLPDQCGPEAACQMITSNTHICVCPHDSSPPTVDLRCPNRLTVPLTPSPIHNIILPNGGNITQVNTTQTQQITTLWQNDGDISIILGLASVAFITLIFCATFCWWKKESVCRCIGNSAKSRKSSCSASPMNLKKGLLVADRYTPNPQYSTCTSLNVPLLGRDTLRFQQEIGEGCFGKVYKGELKREHSDQIEIVAVKVLKETASLEAEEDFMREVDIMSAFRHKNILSLVGVVLRDAGSTPWMVFEYMPHGDLAEVLRRPRNWLHESTLSSNSLDSLPEILSQMHLLSIALQIASGMLYLAAQRFVHRDLACRNCLVGNSLSVKIADFGMSRDVYTCDYYKIGGSRLLPVRWMSPESVMYGRFTLESDVWSYGIVLWEIYAFGKQPYYGHNNEEVVKLILQGIMLIPPEECPSEICDLMRCCWKTEPKDRIRFPEIFERLEKIMKIETSRKQNVGVLNNHENASRYANSIENIDDLINSKDNENNVQLPRPPAIPISPKYEFDLLDPDGYLLPQQPRYPCEYMETLPD